MSNRVWRLVRKLTYGLTLFGIFTVKALREAANPFIHLRDPTAYVQKATPWRRPSRGAALGAKNMRRLEETDEGEADDREIAAWLSANAPAAKMVLRRSRVSAAGRYSLDTANWSSSLIKAGCPCLRLPPR